MKKNKAVYIAIHCSATKPDQNITMETIRQWHLDKGWSDIGYNFVIERDGTTKGGRDLDGDGDHFEEIGAHVRGYNSKAIGICLAGGIDKSGKPDSNFTRHQYKSLETLVEQIKGMYPDSIVQGHRDFPNVAKACPSFDAVAWWGEDVS